MEKKELEKLIGLDLSQREIGDKLNTSQANVKYWLNKFELKTKHKQYNTKNVINKICSLCDKELINNTRNRQLCNVCITRVRRLRLKIKAVGYLGGECKKCGYNKSLASFDFHHLDPNEKDFGISANSHKKSWEALKLELNKCVLLCANCHREEHNKYDDILDNEILKKYGKGFYEEIDEK